MPLTDRDRIWHAGLLLVALLVVTVSVPQTEVQAQEGTGADSKQSADDADSKAGADAAGKAGEAAVVSKRLPGSAPEVAPQTKKEYQLDQRRRVQELRRMQMTMTPQIIASYKENARDFRKLLFQGIQRGNQEQLDILKSGLKYEVLSLSDQDIQANPLLLENAVKKLRGDLGRAGSGIINKAAKAKYREMICAEVFTLLQGLMKHNLIARSTAIDMLQDLEVESATGGGRLTMYEKVDGELVRVMMDNDQPDAVKLRVANTMTNYLQKVDAIPQIQAAFARSIAAELDKPFLDEAYQLFLLATLEEVAISREVVAPKTAIAMCTAAKFMRNKSFEILPRCRAARVLGRAGYDNQMNLEVLAWATADLTSETAFKFSQAADKSDQKWVHCAYYLYTGFHHWDRDEAGGRAPEFPKGFLNRADKSELVRAAYEQSIPIIGNMLESKGVSRTDFAKLIQWVDGNKPANLKYDPTCPPLAMPAAQKPPANPPPGGGG